VPADNFYRRLKEQLDLRFIYPLTAEYDGTEGRKSIDPVVFMKLMLVRLFGEPEQRPPHYLSLSSSDGYTLFHWL
jgi:hypothetical protein